MANPQIWQTRKYGKPANMAKKTKNTKSQKCKITKTY
jgi:hypothetical protein